jgi:hypothetical protein
MILNCLFLDIYISYFVILRKVIYFAIVRMYVLTYVDMCVYVGYVCLFFVCMCVLV